MGCGAPGTFHAFLLLVFVLPWTVQNTFQDDSGSGHLYRSKRGVAKGNQTNKGRVNMFKWALPV